MKKAINLETFAALGRQNNDQPPPSPPETPKPKVWNDWEPIHEQNYPQAGRDLYNSVARYTLAHSEKGSGKTYSCLDKVVKHCFEYTNALGIIVVRVRSQANKGGAWDKLQLQILPKWRKKKGLVHSKVMTDSQKNELIWIQNRQGGWSQVVLISAPYGVLLENTAPGYEPSIVFVDELTECDSPAYFTSLAAQLGRRPGIPGQAQQYLAACNPKGPSNWVYKKWFIESYNEDTGAWDPDFHAIFFPSKDNERNMPEGYFVHLAKVYRNDQISARRLISGEWIDRPSGDALLGGIYSVESHVRPLTEDGQAHPTARLLPLRKSAIIIGVDSGGAYHAFPFLQWAPVDGRMRWVVFDEIVLLRRKLSYGVIIPPLMKRLKFWLDLEEPKPNVISVSDESAFNQFRAGSGSYDVTEIQKVWNARRDEIGVPAIKIKPCPKFDGSVKARIRILQESLANDEFLVSASCKHTQQMLLMIESKKQKTGDYNDDLALTVQRSDHIHIFDAITYPMLLGTMFPSRLIPPADTGSMLVQIHAA
jgi:hypothetical protein